MKRQLALLDYALGALRRRAGRNASIVVGMALVVGLFASVLFLTDGLRREFALGVEGAPDLTVQALAGGRPALVASTTLRELASRRGVRSVEPRVWGYLYVSSLEANLTVVGTRRGAHGDGARPSRVEGRLPAASQEMAIGAALARELGLRVGDRMAFPRPGGFHLLEVVGVFRAESGLRTADLLLTPEDDARILLGVPEGMATDIAIHLGNPDEAAVVSALVRDALPSARVLEKRLLRRTYELTFDERGGLVAAMGLPALVALLLLAWERLTGLSEGERREIGILKAIGWETGDVLTARVMESALLAFAGTAIGLTLAYVFVFVAEAPGLRDALFGWSALYPRFRLTPAVDAAQVLTLLGTVVVPYVAVSLIPAFRAATLDPDRAMRGLS
jgi:ABC-type lipoprotein release transport system permease subunit